MMLNAELNGDKEENLWKCQPTLPLFLTWNNIEIVDFALSFGRARQGRKKSEDSLSALISLCSSQHAANASLCFFSVSAKGRDPSERYSSWDIFISLVRS